jgi:hypothetical protein
MADGKSLYAHRVSYGLFVGPIPDGLIVCHKCDNGHCVNPAHLFLGTHKDNSDDKWAKGRGPDQRGERNPYAKLNSVQVAEIRALRWTSATQAQVGQIYGVNRCTIKSIWNGHSWAS